MDYMVTKVIKFKNCSRNKLTKKQLVELRSRKYIIYERSYENCLNRLTICKARINSNPELYKYSFERVKRLLEYIHAAYLKELISLGYMEEGSHYLNISLSPKLRRIKLSLN